MPRQVAVLGDFVMTIPKTSTQGLVVQLQKTAVSSVLLQFGLVGVYDRPCQGVFQACIAMRRPTSAQGANQASITMKLGLLPALRVTWGSIARGA